ncbi:hypothetical protein AMJ80_09990 [bacterium SM23_31]|nr:MAG: hypothetical protein AMJ80_09990 [bacterium SM23_31]
MKIQLPFLKGISIICLSIFISFFNCNSDVDVQTTEIQPLLTDVLTLELSIGEISGLKDDFILVNPQYLDVNFAGDILVLDESRIKVYEKSGKGKKIVGRPGQGPGEFETGPLFFLSPEGFVTVVDHAKSPKLTLHSILSSSGFESYYNLFSPNYNFIEKKKIKNKVILSEYLKTKYPDSNNTYYIAGIFTISDTDKVYEVIVKNGSLLSDVRYNRLLLYDNSKAIDLIKESIHLEFGVAISEKGNINPQPIGGIYWGLITGRKIMYVNTEEDRHIEPSGSFYTVHVLSLDTFEEQEIIHSFTPVILPENVKKRKFSMPSKSDLRKMRRSTQQMFTRMEEVYNFLINDIKSRQFYPSICGLRIDRDYAFLFLNDGKDRKEKLADVIDLDTMKHVTLAEFPFIPASIKNVYVYEIAQDEEGFSEIRKYRIDPAVYGK